MRGTAVPKQEDMKGVRANQVGGIGEAELGHDALVRHKQSNFCKLFGGQLNIFGTHQVWPVVA